MKSKLPGLLLGMIGWFAAALLSAQVQAAAPMVKSQGPGFYRLMVGDFEVTALLDGVQDFAVKQFLKHVTPDDLNQRLKDAFEPDQVPTSFNAYLINTGSQLILVDTGADHIFLPGLGHLLDNLKASGYQPEQIDQVFITHMHLDHIGGLLHDGKRAFPNAIVRAERKELDYWMSQKNMEEVAAIPQRKAEFAGAQTSLKPYIDAGKFKAFDGKTTLLPGITAWPAYGHTAGHTVYQLESKGKTLMIVGDLAHVGSVQIPEPAVTIIFDNNSEAAAAEREKLFADFADKGYLLAGMHLAFPGLGHLRAHDKGYVWVPVTYDSTVR